MVVARRPLVYVVVVVVVVVVVEGGGGARHMLVALETVEQRVEQTLTLHLVYDHLVAQRLLASSCCCCVVLARHSDQRRLIGLDWRRFGQLLGDEVAYLRLNVHLHQVTASVCMYRNS